MNSFVLYASYQEQIELLTMEQRGVLLTAIFSYVTDSEPPDMDGTVRMAFSFIRADLDKNAEKYEKTVTARKEAGQRGGRPKANGFSEKQKNQMVFSEKQKNQMVFSETKQKQKNPDDEYEDDDEYDDEDDVKEKPSKEGQKKRRFTPPTRTELLEYCQEQGYSIDADRFIDYYESKGWMVGKNPMKDWKAAVRNWARSQRQESTAEGRQEKTVKNSFCNFPQRTDTDWDELERQLVRKSMGLPL